MSIPSIYPLSLLFSDVADLKVRKEGGKKDKN